MNAYWQWRVLDRNGHDGRWGFRRYGDAVREATRLNRVGQLGPYVVADYFADAVSDV